MGSSASEHDPWITVDAMLQAVNDHQLETLAASFDLDYVNETPSHPQRSFQGSTQVKKNWAQIFAAVPDVTARVLRSTVDGKRVWVELEMSGSKLDGGSFLMRGVVIFAVAEDVIRSARFYLEPVEETSGSVNAAVDRVTRSSGRDT
jgi:hypothetical protein